MLKKFKSFGPKISLTDSQIAKVAKLSEVAGLQSDVENCGTGSCYVTIYETEMTENIRGEPRDRVPLGRNRGVLFVG